MARATARTAQGVGGVAGASAGDLAQIARQPSGELRLVRRRAIAGGTDEQEFAQAADGSYRLARTRSTAVQASRDYTVQSTEDADVTVLAVREAPAREAARRGAALSPGAPDARSPGGPGGPIGANPQMIVCDPNDPAACDPPPPDPPPDSTPAPVGGPAFNFTGQPCAAFGFCPPAPGPLLPICFGYFGVTWCWTPPLPPLPPPPTDPGPTSPAFPAVGFVFEHGFLSDAATFATMQTQLRTTYPTTNAFGQERDWRAPIGAQAAQAASEMLLKPDDYYIMIGHSMGGLVSRDMWHRMADQARAGQRRTSPFGVITIGTPHLGAPIVNALPVLIPTVIDGINAVRGAPCTDLAVFSNIMSSLCLATLRVGEFAQDRLSQIVPAASRADMAPGSAYLAARNAQQDLFARASIQSQAPPRWIMFRLAGDGLGTCQDESTFCNGDGAALAAETGYQSLRALAATFWSFRLGYLYMTARNAADRLDYLDTQWANLTTQGDQTTDGIVPGRSQAYPTQGLLSGPGTGLRFVVIPNGPTHIAETGSRRVVDATTGLLEDFFRIRTFPSAGP